MPAQTPTASEPVLVDGRPVKLFVYAMREFDELPFFKAACEKLGVEFTYTCDYQCLDNTGLAKGADVVVLMPATTDRAMIQAWHDLGVKHIATRNIGYDHIDTAAARELGMHVSNATYTPESVADYAIMMAMMLLRRMPQICDRARVQDYTLRGKMGRCLADCTVGVVGTGRIGSTVINHLKGFGCDILAYDVYPNDRVAESATYVDLDELLSRADVVSLHAPLMASNHHMIDEHAFSLMKDDAVLVNTARGGLIDTEALIATLEQGRLAGVALDVLEQEDGLYYANRVGDVIANRQMAILRSFPNVILSPHTAFYTDTDVRQMVEGAVEASVAMMSGRADECRLVVA